MTLQPNATNKVNCTVCDWARVLDPMREYRGGHTNPANMQECHEMLQYAQMSAFPIEVYLLGEERPKTPAGEVSGLLNWGGDDPVEEEAKRVEGEAEQARNALLDEQIAELYEATEIPTPPEPD